MAVIPADFSIRATGELQPRERYHVFAPDDGVVVSLREADNHPVRQADELARLQSAELELRISELLGMIGTVQEERDAVAIRMFNAPESDRSAAVDLSARKERLTKELEGLEERRAISLQQQQELTIGSPAVGNTDYKISAEDALESVIRVVNKDDPVPYLMEDLPGYQHLDYFIELAEDGGSSLEKTSTVDTSFEAVESMVQSMLQNKTPQEHKMTEYLRRIQKIQ